MKDARDWASEWLTTANLWVACTAISIGLCSIGAFWFLFPSTTILAQPSTMTTMDQLRVNDAVGVVRLAAIEKQIADDRRDIVALQTGQAASNAVGGTIIALIGVFNVLGFFTRKRP